MADKELTLLSRIRTWFTIKYTLDWKTAFMSRLKHREISFLHSISDLNVRSSHTLCPFKSRDLPQWKRSVTPEASLVYVFKDRRREKKWMNVLFLCLSILSLTCRGLLYPLSSFPSPGKRRPLPWCAEINRTFNHYYNWRMKCHINSTLKWWKEVLKWDFLWYLSLTVLNPSCTHISIHLY